jgi:hypothetical protein
MCITFFKHPPDEGMEIMKVNRDALSVAISLTATEKTNEIFSTAINIIFSSYVSLWIMSGSKQQL